LDDFLELTNPLLVPLPLEEEDLLPPPLDDDLELVLDDFVG
jgi:hypothetical protein